MERVKCQRCGRVNAEGRRVCDGCGAPLPLVGVHVLAPPAAKGEAPDQSRFEHGQIIAGRYTVERLIGQGGMGCIYRVYDNVLNEVVALKTLLPQYLTDKTLVERFFNEARIARSLSHPNIVRVHDIGTAGAAIYISMEYLQGKSLRDVLDQLAPGQHLALKTVLKIFDELCAALEYAHQYTVHRDIKPENVMVCQDGKVKLMDFGISKLMANPKLTSASMVMGTPQYMSPEQLRNSAGVDGRADIYSLGVMLYEALTGGLPVGFAKPVSQLGRRIPAELDPIIAKCLEHDPAKRFQNARELRAALRDVAARLADPARASESIASVTGGGRPRWRFALAAALIALIAAASAGALWKADTQRRQRTAQPPAPGPAPMGQDPAAPFESLRPMLKEAEVRAKRAILAENDPAVKTILEERTAEADKLASMSIELGKVDEKAAFETGWKALHLYLGVSLKPAGMLFVPPGPVSLAPGQPPVELDAFFIDETEVTWADYLEFCRREGWPPPTAPPPADLRLPVTHVSFYDAYAFAAAQSPPKKLPTEVQWARAAFGPEGAPRRYPWGDEWGEGREWPAAAAPLPVKRNQDDLSPLGCYDLFRNVAEWTRSLRAPLPYDPNDGREDPDRLTFGAELVVRGGHYEDGLRLTLLERMPAAYAARDRRVGFRCILELPREVPVLRRLLQTAQ